MSLEQCCTLHHQVVAQRGHERGAGMREPLSQELGVHLLNKLPVFIIKMPYKCINQLRIIPGISPLGNKFLNLLISLGHVH